MASSSNSQRRGYEPSIETNGTIALPEGLLDWICVSPKDQMYPSQDKATFRDELKCVYVGQDLTMYDDLFEGFSHHFLQPCYIEGESIEWNGRHFAQTGKAVKDNPRWRLSCKHISGWGSIDANGYGFIWWNGFNIIIATFIDSKLQITCISFTMGKNMSSR